ncbi:MAG: hypothetical protein A3C84_01330 [Candidatus Ryanbacteria bacterium RIFCSPHIGHO2_02_FULL_48_12]|uniref:Uncharacterized protein n=1 Tax=Candidatus Ryanbacteria bacterium RIFCSPHIGHO2_01_FULL_48_27 TaxID=1802115 RepID=A0A1G2G410_9BACT|nr:MAG: hypothetical protein A2756_03835 [Candidatus Ryanbacteria bacterium RIFCSPHIGHO2_01_FULL_48_27]OGZ50751.1 MAG: hypothetical protein A3C84_01330 [Candidatus Ryanbacteria bacterium RIFCSPHIGHO2_02_FULL_48_12]
MYTEDRSRLVELLGVVVKESSPHGEMPEAAEPLAKALIGAILYNDPLFFGGAVTSLLRQLIEEARSHNTWVTEEEWRRAEVLALLLERSFRDRGEAITREIALGGRNALEASRCTLVPEHTFREAA